MKPHQLRGRFDRPTTWQRATPRPRIVDPGGNLCTTLKDQRVGGLRLPLLVASLAIAASVLLMSTCGDAAAFIVKSNTGTFLGVQLRAGSSLGSSISKGPRSSAFSQTRLEWHNGDVLHANKAYALFWDPSGTYPETTEANIDQYFADVATDSGQASNVYSVAVQYSDSGGSAAYKSTFGSAFVLKEGYPKGTCSDPVGHAVCISDGAVETEVSNFVAAFHLPTQDALYFVYLPPNVVTCMKTSVCSDNSFCAYHKVTSSSPHILYANMPYEVQKACQKDGNSVTQEPNGDPSDVLVKTTSHEHIESITNPFGDGWYNNATGAEIGDKCNGSGDDANAFLPTLGGEANTGTLYTQLIGGHQYYLQSEWSNNGERCAMGFAPFQSEEVFVAVGNGRVQRRSPSGSLVGTLQTGSGSYTTGMAFDQADNLYVTDFGAGRISRFDALGNLEGIFGTGLSSNPESILFNKAGDAFVGQEDGGVIELDQNGALLQSFATGRSDWIELGPDQCTLYYTDEGESGGILRYNVCTNEPMSEFVPRSALTHPYALRLLPSGGLLVADTDSIKRFDESGDLIQTYTHPGDNNWFALNLDPDGTSFYSADFETGEVVKFDIASGKALLEYNTNTGPNTVFGIVVNGELTLGSGAEVFGTITEPGGADVAGALVQACPAAGGSCFETKSNSHGGYLLAGLNPSDYDVTAFPPKGSSLGSGGTGPLTLTAGQSKQVDLQLAKPSAPPPNVSISPIRGSIGGIPIVDFGKPFSFAITGCPGGSASYVVKPFLTFLTGVAEGSLAEAPAGSGRYSGTLTPPATWFGPANVKLTLVCPGGKHEDAAFTLYIDPSGEVVTEGGAPVSGATITLYRGEGPFGPFTEVPNESPIMSPQNRANPDTTAANGTFGWDVIAGYYTIRAEKPGCNAPGEPSKTYVESDVLEIPPAMSGLRLVLHCAEEPTAVTTTLSGGGQSGAHVAVPEGTPVVDQATLSGGGVAGAGGTVDYKVFSDPACTHEAASAGQVMVTSGTVPDSTPETFAPGVYYWQATYSGDGAHEAATSACGTEVETVEAAVAHCTAVSGHASVSIGKQRETVIDRLSTNLAHNQRLRFQWGSGAGKVLLNTLTTVSCAHAPKHDTFAGAGTATVNGESGWHARFTFAVSTRGHFRFGLRLTKHASKRMVFGIGAGALSSERIF